MSRDVAQLALAAAGTSFRLLTESVDQGAPKLESAWHADSVIEALRVYAAEVRKAAAGVRDG